MGECVKLSIWKIISAIQVRQAIYNKRTITILRFLFFCPGVNFSTIALDSISSLSLGLGSHLEFLLNFLGWFAKLGYISLDSSKLYMLSTQWFGRKSLHFKFFCTWPNVQGEQSFNWIPLKMKVTPFVLVTFCLSQ